MITFHNSRHIHIALCHPYATWWFSSVLCLCFAAQEGANKMWSCSQDRNRQMWGAGVHSWSKHCDHRLRDLCYQSCTLKQFWVLMCPSWILSTIILIVDYLEENTKPEGKYKILVCAEMQDWRSHIFSWHAWRLSISTSGRYYWEDGVY